MKFNWKSLFLASLLFTGCGSSRTAPGNETKETYIADANSVGFDISPAPGSGPSAWIGTYSSQGKTAQFRFEFDQPKDIDSGVKGFPVASGHGRFIALEGSDASTLLVDLGKALEAKKLPGKVVRVAQLPFAYVRIGENQSQAPNNGGFNTEPRGNWTPTKIFIGEGDQECQFFLNFNPIIRKGQFSIKDEEYGDEVLAQLAKVL